jgi:phosphoserine phosphatase
MIIASDLEGTLTTGETWRGVGRYVSHNGRKWAYWRYLAAHVPRVPLVKLGLIDRQRERYRWVEDMPATLKGCTLAQLGRMAEWVVEREMWPLRRQAVIDELAALRRDGARLVLVSGTFQPILDAFARRLDAAAVATPLEVRDGLATGRLAGPLNVEQAKVDRVRAWLKVNGADGAGIERMYGDTLGDLHMLEMCRAPVCVCPNPALRQIALQRGWRVFDV